MRGFEVGEPVVYLMTKQSSHPTLRATTVSPAAHGDDYSYVVKKFWVVREICTDGTLIVQTRKGKARRVSADDPCLRHASLWERWMYRDRFPESDLIEPIPAEPRPTPEKIGQAG
ncbi:MAG: hypothetical protein ACE37I_20955 [Rubinisphaera brasiliensis]|uniref:Uncharacterized protein n=1 Tax=Rubinisphaera brasiliensis (strain ATCC 49424 / DSM 5305 / JCM 21570 / IAM 15109 / NBRC 103401 / IFAM 1448) TaxID=756272 RepID=F0SRR4_RUBBR|nr:hypothetical protein [Rubinisphaera brasiliensis]ADY59187.1 hypothetical protein Plabr_1576 [Rubinisphaera brasiliensis DSM 5305]MBB02651.1 hypothetical protein [Planctomyces sp.]